MIVFSSSPNSRRMIAAPAAETPSTPLRATRSAKSSMRLLTVEEELLSSASVGSERGVVLLGMAGVDMSWFLQGTS